MAGMHLSEIELLEVCEKELGGRELADAEAHLEGCAVCRTGLRELEAGRAVLRASPRFELPPTVLRAVLGSLPAQDREPRTRRWLESPRRLALVVLPVAAVAIVAATVSLTVGGNGDDAASERAAAETVLEAQAEASAGEAAQDSASEEAEGGAVESPSAATESASATQPVLVVGPVEEVVKILEDAGLTVRAEGVTITIVGAGPEEVARLLAGRPAGDVEVVVAP